MSTVMVPADMLEALAMLEGALGFLADMDAAGMSAQALAEGLRALERADAVGAAARGQLLAAFDAQDGSVADGQRTARTWLVHSTRVTRGQAAEHKAVQGLAEGHRPLLAGLREGDVITKSVALQLARWTAAIPGSSGRRPGRSWSARPGPGPICGRWPRSAPKSAPVPLGRIPMTRTTGTWTGQCRWTPPSMGPG